MDALQKYQFKLAGDLANPSYLDILSQGDNCQLSLALLVRKYTPQLRNYLGGKSLGNKHLIYPGPISPSKISGLLAMDDVLAISLIDQRDKLVGLINVEVANVDLDLEQLTES